MLIQLEVNDHRKIDDIIKENNIRKLKSQANCLWPQYQIGDIYGMNFSNLDLTFQVLQEYYLSQVNANQGNHQKINHNKILKQIEQEIKQFLEQRAMLIIETLQQSFQELLQDNSTLRIELQQLFNNFCQFFDYCDQKCFQCNLNCNQRIRHQQQQQIYYDTIQNDISNEKNKQNEINNQLKNQKCYNKQLHDHLKEQINQGNKEIQYLRLNKNKQSTLNNLKHLFNIQILDELKINEYMLNFLWSNFQGIKDKNNIEICEKIIENNQSQLNEELKNKQDILRELVQDNEKQYQQQNLQNLQKQSFQSRLFKLKEQIKQVQEQLERSSQQQDPKFQKSKDTIANLEQLQNKINQKKNQLKTMMDQQIELQHKIQFKLQEIIQNSIDKEIDFLLEIELLPQFEMQLQQLIFKQNQDSINLENLNKYLQKYQGNHQQLNQINKITQDIQKIQIGLQNNIKKQEYIKDQMKRLKSVQVNNLSHDEIAQIILENEQSELIAENKALDSSLEIIQVDLIDLELEYNQQNQNQKLINLELDLQNYKSEIQIVQKQQANDIEVKCQDSIFDNIERMTQQVEQVKSVFMNNQINIQIFQQMKDQSDLLIDYNIQLKELENISLSGKDQQTLEINVKKLKEQLQQLEEINKLKQQLAQSEMILCELEQKLNNIKIDINRSHNCGFENHDCNEICQGCENHDAFCKFKAGHIDPTHLCQNKKHFCKFKCKIEDCQNICQIEYAHNEHIPHNCLEQHQCHYSCNFCLETCSLNASDNHQIHLCQKNYCNQECYFNKNYFGQEKCQNPCTKLHNEKHDIHICQNQHQCNYQCDQPGICQIGNYTEKQSRKHTENGSFLYTIYEQNAVKKQCQFQIQRGMIKHQGLHKCEEKTHSCDSRCPECDAYCDKQFVHQGNHSVNQHRNKEKQLFTHLVASNKDQVEIQQGQDTRIYRVGESCYPETCSLSCKRRDRAHFHLIPCPGQAGQGECLATSLNNEKNQVAKHQPNQYLGSNLIYDEILCNQYWEYYKWEHPVNKKYSQLISLCNYYCQKCDKELQDKYFCTKLAWHTDTDNYNDHQFSCSENHKFYGIDIAFVIDSTETMRPYADIIRQSINKFQYASDKYQKDNNAIKYSIVSYTDHDDQQLGYKNDCVKFIDFTNHQSVQQFVNNITFEHSNDYCEAMLDGLNKASQLKWREKSQKYIFLIADAPPHGANKFYNPSLFHIAFDNNPNGCPCGLIESYVLKNLKDFRIKLVVLKLNDQLNLTIRVFQDIMNEVIILTSSEEMRQENFIKEMEEMICECLKNDEITLGTD